MKTRLLNLVLAFVISTAMARAAAAPATPATDVASLVSITNLPMISNAAPSASAATRVSGPRIKFAKVEHDFGRITAGDSVKAEFIFTNIGDKTLEITDVRPGCGCTTAGEWTRKVEPGQTGIVPLQFNSSSFSGSIQKTPSVACNDPTQQVTTLYLKGTIWRPIEVTPQFVALTVSPENPSNSAIVRIVNHLEQPITVSDLESKNPSFAAKLNTVTPGKEYTVEVSTIPPLPNTVVQGFITLKTSSTNMPLINITVSAYVQATVQAMPGQISIPAGPLLGAILQNVMVRNSGTNLITLSEPSINLTNVDIKMTPYQPGRFFSFGLTFPAGTRINPNEKVEFTVKTSHPFYPILKVPVVQAQQGVPGVPYAPVSPAVYGPPKVPPGMPVTAPARPPGK